MAKSKYPNQITINFKEKIKTDKEHPYCLYNTEAMQKAMKNLKGESFKLWCYLAYLPVGTEFALGQTPVENYTGIKKDTYYTSKDLLIEKGYIVKEDDNRWYFYEEPKRYVPTAKDF